MVYCLAESDVDAHIAADYLDQYPGADRLSVAQIATNLGWTATSSRPSGMSQWPAS